MPTSIQVQEITWEQLVGVMNWRQGEHVTMVGPTGQGKTTLALHLMKIREQASGHICVVATKPRDATVDILRKRGYRVTKTWPPDFDAKRVILWPPFRKPKDIKRQREIVQYALSDMFAQHAWCIYIDELPYVSDVLKMDRWLKVLWLQGRALDITLVSGTQRPRYVPLEAYSSSTHMFLWRTNDEDDLKRISGLGSFDSRTIRDVVARLPRHYALYVGTRDDVLAIVKSPPPE